MKNVIRNLIMGAAMVLALPSLLSAQLIERISSEELLAFCKTQGDKCLLKTNRIVEWKIGDFRTSVILSGKGNQIMFRAGFGDVEVTMKKVNDWNKTVHFSRSYIDDDGDPVLELDLALDGGVSKARILDFLDTCKKSYLLWLIKVIL